MRFHSRCRVQNDLGIVFVMIHKNFLFKFLPMSCMNPVLFALQRGKHTKKSDIMLRIEIVE